jgi:autotransporter passenger strand-loop-strand repeat protein
MGSDAKNLMSDGNVQIVKTGEVIGATQLTEGELIVEAGGRAENTVVTGAGWLKVATGGIAKCTQYGNNGTLSVSDGAIATDIVQSEGGAISLSTLATVNGRHPEGEFSVDKGYACGLLLENGGNLRVLEGHRAEKIILDQEGGLLVNGTTSAVVVDEGGELLVYPGGEASNCEINQGGVFMLAGKASDTLLAGGTMNNLGGEDDKQHVVFHRDNASEKLNITLLSRTGILPEADFYCPIPYEPLHIVTDQALNAEIQKGEEGLLDRVESTHSLREPECRFLCSSLVCRAQTTRPI